MADQSFADILEQSTARCRQMNAPLADRLAAMAADVDALSPQFAEIVERMVAHLKANGVGETAPAPGEPMPPFVLPDQDGNLIGLEPLLERGPVVLSFHRGGWCPYCRISADALARLEPEVAAAGARIAIITPDLEKFNAELQADAKATFPVLTDLDNGYALQLNLVIKVPEEKRQAMTIAGWDISAFQSNEAWTLPIPATFVIDADGIVKARFVDPDYRRRMTTEDILRALQPG